MNKTFAILKPDVVKAGRTFELLADLESNGFVIQTIERFRFTDIDVESFYKEHVGKDFFPKHVEFMISGDCYAVELHADNAVQKLRNLIGYFQPSEAEEGTIRNKYGTVSPANAIHASDSDEAAETELDWFGW